MRRKMTDDLTVILPTLNEVGNLESLILALGTELPGCRVIVVDDNSSDGTQELVKRIAANNPSVRLIERHVVPCLPDSIRGGFSAAPPDYGGWRAAALPHPPAVMRKLYEVAQSSGCCIG